MRAISHASPWTRTPKHFGTVFDTVIGDGLVSRDSAPAMEAGGRNK